MRKLFILFIIAVLSIFIGVTFGSAHLDITDIIKIIINPDNSINSTIIMSVRIPRVITTFTVGGMLALAGSYMQTLLRNPLADPYVLGISGGAAVMSLLAMLAGFVLTQLYIWGFIGSLISIFIVFVLGHNKKNFDPFKLLLTGVVIAAFWSAIISFILTISPTTDIKGMLFWLMGDLSYTQFSYAGLGLLFVCLITGLFFARSLNILALGENTAKNLGVNLKVTYIFLYLASSLLTAFAVSEAGCIGFVGLIIPHSLRLIGGVKHEFVLLGSVLLGGSFLVLADTLSRSLFAPIQIPIGVITAIIGVPCFLFILRHIYSKA
jgi:iron complex transport system permease protein